MKNILLLILLFIPYMISCTDENPIEMPEQPTLANKVNVSLDIKVPAEKLPSNSRATYALDLILFSFDASTGNYLSHTTFTDYDVPEEDETTTLNVTLLESSTSVKLVLIANSGLNEPATITNYSSLTSLVFTQLTTTDGNVTEAITTEANIPMWGECTLTTVAQGTTGTINLLRALAKVTINVEETSGLSDVSVKLLNINTKGQIVPNNVTDYNNGIISVPSENSTVSISKSGNQTSFLIPESTSGTENTNRISVILKAKYQNSESYNYYRLDLYTKGDDGTLLTQLQRNHHYIFTISLVNHAGYPTEEAAIDAVYADNARIIGGNVFVIQDTGIMEITTDEFYYFGVNSSSLNMIQSDGYKVGRLKIITNNATNFSYECSSTDIQVTFPTMRNNEASKTWIYYTGSTTTGTLGTITLISGNIRKEISLIAE